MITLEQRVAVLEAVVAQLQLEIQRFPPRRRHPEDFDDDELGLDTEDEDED